MGTFFFPTPGRFDPHQALSPRNGWISPPCPFTCTRKTTQNQRHASSRAKAARLPVAGKPQNSDSAFAGSVGSQQLFSPFRPRLVIFFVPEPVPVDGSTNTAFGPFLFRVKGWDASCRANIWEQTSPGHILTESRQRVLAFTELRRCWDLSASPSPPPVLPVVTAAWQPLGLINFYAASGVQERIGATTHSHRKILGQRHCRPLRFHA